MNNDVVNFLSTLVGALTAIGLYLPFAGREERR
jgi:uncharacterized membrane protein